MAQSFDTPRTKALAAFLKAEGPDGSGRVVGLSIEPDGVFVYTESAAWCDDSGAGTFRGDSETGAIAAFKANVRPGNGCPEYPAPADSTVPAGPCGCAACLSGRFAAIASTDGPRMKTPRESALDPRESFATVYRNAAPDGRPVATMSRPRRGDSHGLFTLCDTSGRLVRAWTRMPTVAAVRAALVNVAELAEELADTPTAEEAEERAEEANARGIDARERAKAEDMGTPRRALLLNLASLSARLAEIYADRAAALKADVRKVYDPMTAPGGHAGYVPPVDVDSAIRSASVSGPFPVRRPRSLSAAAVPAPVLYLAAEDSGVYLYTAEGVWTGPGLGRFDSVRAARVWASRRGYEVAELVTGEEVAAIRTAAMRASVPALQAAARALSRRSGSLPALQAAAARVRARIVAEVAELKAGAIRPDTVAAFALSARPCDVTPSPAALRNMRATVRAIA